MYSITLLTSTATQKLDSPYLTPLRTPVISIRLRNISKNTFFLQMLMNARLSQGYAREETASIQWAPLNVGAQLVTSRAKLLKSVKVSVFLTLNLRKTSAELESCKLLINIILCFNRKMMA